MPPRAHLFGGAARIQKGQQCSHFRRLMTELSVEFVGGQVAITTPDRGSQVFVGVFGIRQQSLQTVGGQVVLTDARRLRVGGGRGRVAVGD